MNYKTLNGNGDDFAIKLNVDKMIVGLLRQYYKKARRDGELEIIETLDALRVWKDGEPVVHLERAWRAIQGDSDSQCYLGELLSWPYGWMDCETYPSDPDPETAYFWYERAARAGDKWAKFHLMRALCPKSWTLPKERLNGEKAVELAKEVMKDPDDRFLLPLAACVECGRCWPGGANPNLVIRLRKRYARTPLANRITVEGFERDGWYQPECANEDSDKVVDK